MYKTVITQLSSLLFIFHLGQSVAAPALIQPLASQSLLLDIEQTQNYLYAVGERGHILRAIKNPANEIDWLQMPVPTQSTLTEIFVNDDVIWVTGHDTSILSSSDQGTSWQLSYQDINLGLPLFDIFFFDQNNGIAVGAYGTFLRTQNGGQTWQSEQHESLLNQDDREYLAELKQDSIEEYTAELNAILPHINKLMFDQFSNTLWATGELGLVAYSQDQGRNWQRINEFYNGSLFDLTLIERDIYVAGLRGNIFKANLDQLDNWQPLLLPDAVNVNQLVVTDLGFYVLANTDVVYFYQFSTASYKQLGALTAKTLTAGTYYQQQLHIVGEQGILVLPLNQPLPAELN